MTILKNFSVLKKLKLPICTNQGAMCIKFYSDTGCNDKDKEICVNKNPGNVKIAESKKKMQENSKSKSELNCKKNGIVSVAIVGGGYAVVCATILLKQNPSIKEIRIIDTDNSLSGPVCDIRQIDTSISIKHYKRSSILEGLHNSDIVALMDETNFSMGNKGPFAQFILSSNYVKSIAECMINACPTSIIAVFARPVTATLPLVSEIYRQSGQWNPNKIIGSAAIESMRISAMTARILDLNASFLSVPIAGGIDSLTVVPLLSRTRPFNNFSVEDQCTLTQQLRSADKNLFESGTQGPTMSSGVATAKFISTLINGLQEKSISIANAYVRSDILPSCQYMTSELRFGPTGVEQNFGLPKVSSKELSLIEQAVPMINKIANTVDQFIHCGKIK